MFEPTKVGRSVSKQDFKQQQEQLRTELLAAQRDLREANFPVVVLIAGIEAAGKGEVVNRLDEWLDSRGVRTFAFWDESDEERERPRFWRFWRALPERGEMSILFGGWYQAPIEYRFHRHCNDAELDAELNRIVSFERMLIEDGALIVKFWFHMSAREQKARLKELSRDDRSRWKMLPDKTKFSEQYADFERVAERVIQHTDLGISPWHLVEAEDRRYRDLTVGKTLLHAIRSRLNKAPPQETPIADANLQDLELPASEDARITVLDTLDLSLELAKDDYKKQLKKLQREINELTWNAYKQGISTVLVFEGVDAAGKGGAIRRMTNAIDARLYHTIPVAAPTDEEKAHHYLWRFWRQLPRAGHISVFDRSWYGRVLVERVEGFAGEAEWRRAYSEINRFEEQLAGSGIVLIKFWLHIDQDEQLQRFKAREEIPYKQYKITEEDWRNREKWPAYESAINEMIARTSTRQAPWTLVEATDKHFARVKVLKTLHDHLSAALQQSPNATEGYLPCGDKRIGDNSE